MPASTGHAAGSLTKPRSFSSTRPAMLSALTRQSLNRLKDRLDEFGYDGIRQTEYGYIMRLGAARRVFLSADESYNVVGSI
jgi:hypothetical protein